MRLKFGEVNLNFRFVAERIHSLSPIRRTRLYPWREWMDGAPWRIRRGEDFEVTPAAMASMIRTKAAKSGRAVETRVIGDVIEFQFAGQEAA